MGASYTKPAEVQSKYFPAFKEELPGQEGKTHVVTGTTSGTGFIFARTICEKGGRVLCLNRPSERATTALEDIKASVPNADITQVDCDLKSFDSVRSAAEKVKELCPDGVDALVNNAGIMGMPDEACEGYDVQMHVNCLSHFLLTKELFPLLEQAALRTGEARVVNHSSVARTTPGTDLSRKHMEKNGGDLGGNSNGLVMNGPRWERYHQTKLYNLVHTYAMADKLEAKGSGVKSLCAHPGLSATNLQSTTVSAGGMWQNPLTTLFMKLAQSQEDGTMGILYAAAGPSDRVPNGGLFGPAGVPGLSGPAVSLPREKETLADKQVSKDLLWECSEAAVGVFNI